MSDEWPYSTWYRVDERIDGWPPLSYDMSLPPNRSTFDMSTLRIGRHGGPNAEDEAFRVELYRRVGAVTVAGGHVETAMKRLLLLFMGDVGGFSVVDKTWSDLHKAIEAECTGADERRISTAEVLSWGEEHKVKKRRDDVVHAYWWTFAGCGARRSRFYRKTEGTTIGAQLEDLDEDASMLFEYAEMLDRLLWTDWPEARLPRSETDRM